MPQTRKGMKELSYALEMRDTISKMVSEEIQKQRPKYRYAIVDSLDLANHKADVIFNGETNAVTINTNHFIFVKVGDVVRVEGIGIDKFIADIVGWDGTVSTPTELGHIANKDYVDDAVVSSIDSAVEITGGEQIGDLAWSAAATRENSLPANGQAVSRTTYADLNAHYEALGYPHGAGDGSTTFNLPNIAGKVVAGRDASDPDFDTVGDTPGGLIHSHGLTPGEAWAQIYFGPSDVSSNQVAVPDWTRTLYSSGLSRTLHSANIPWGAAGVDGNTDNGSSVQPTIVLNAFIVFAVDAIAVSGAASSAPDPSKLAQRDASGRLQVVDPAVAADVATKGYADSLVPTALPVPQRSIASDTTLDITASAWAVLPAGGASDIVLASVPQRMLVLVNIYGWLQNASGTDVRVQVRAFGATTDDSEWPRRIYTGSTYLQYAQYSTTYYVEVEPGDTTFEMMAYRNGSGTASLNYSGFEVVPVRWL